ncbi:hypothetical protein KR222_005267 [Zaprionus bogoriensis]|nr:hypothetical protein KR222_005267 [Zaprionus bogoriensis]
MRNPLWFIFWLIVLLSVSFIVAFVGAFLYIWMYLFSQCCDCFRVSVIALVSVGPYLTSDPCLPQSVAEFFLKCAQFPGYCVAAMLNCQSLC